MRKYKLIYILIIFTPVVTLSYGADFIEGTDITDILNKKINSTNTVVIPKGRFKIDAVKSIVLKDNISIRLDPKTYLEVIPNKEKNYQVFRIHNVKNINISGGNLIGDKYSHLDSKGEWGMGVEIKDSQNINISNMNIDKMWGDAIYIGTNGKNSNYNISLFNIKMNDNRRQGLSIISVEGLIANNIKISNTKGRSPMNGVDIEPNNNSNILKSIRFENLKSVNNVAAGFQVSLHKYNESKNEISIELNNYIDSGSRFGIKINGITTPVKGSILINNADISNSKTSNYCFKDWRNNKINVIVNQINHDREYVKNQPEWCAPYEFNKNIKIIKNN